MSVVTVIGLALALMLGLVLVSLVVEAFRPAPPIPEKLG